MASNSSSSNSSTKAKAKSSDLNKEIAELARRFAKLTGGGSGRKKIDWKKILRPSEDNNDW